MANGDKETLLKLKESQTLAFYTRQYSLKGTLEPGIELKTPLNDYMEGVSIDDCVQISVY